MFENLSERLERSFKILKGEGRITEVNVAETLKDVRKALLDGRVVVMEGLGRISVGIKARCFNAETMADSDFQPSMMIKDVHINFRPDVNILKDLRSKRSLRRISSEAME